MILKSSCHQTSAKKSFVRWFHLSWFLLGITLMVSCDTETKEDFRYLPYLQNPSPSAMTIMWFSETNIQGELSYGEQGLGTQGLIISEPTLAKALSYPKWEDTTFFNGQAPSVPFQHRVRIENLKPATGYTYTVAQGESSFSAFFKTAPGENAPVRFIVYSDSETEPESTGKHARWDGPVKEIKRAYPIDQTEGYRNNLELIQNREPDLIIIAGDLVESGGEQRDWDEFWSHNTNPEGEKSIASKIPIIAAMGNHEYYEGPLMDRYNQPGSERAANKYLSYFEYPSNQAPHEEQRDRYYHLNYGPAVIITLDLCNNTPGKSDEDTNHFLLGENDPSGGFAPDFGPHSQQYKWLEQQLEDAQGTSLFTFVVFHHAPYSSGPHGLPPGGGDNFDKQSGNATRLLTPLFLRYGVDAVFNGHDEIWERSKISGMEIKSDGNEVEHSIQFYDVGIGGDGLRAPLQGLENPYQQFLVHTDALEEWDDGVLIDGGKHYGHLEVDISPLDADTWRAELKPIYVFPLLDDEGKASSTYTRRMYDDKITLIRSVK